MEKNMYETYEYLPSNSIETEHDQFFVVQNDGTLLFNRQVQYITQVQDVKGVLENVQTCTVFDVPSQQFYVDVDNSTELISVTDQFSLSPDNESNVYGSNYLLQPIAETSMISQDVVSNDIEQASTELDMDVSESNDIAIPMTESTSLTAVTITDEQYHILEKKGWVILSINDKVLLLNALGLHDITGNEKLIQQLKTDYDSCEEVPTITTDIEDINTTYPVEEMVINELTDETGTVKLVFSDNIVTSNVKDNLPLNDEEEAKTSTTPEVDNFETPEKLDSKDSINPKQEAQKNCTVVRLNTNLCLKDIPKKIILGKTVNGKKLVAKIVKVKKVGAPNSNNDDQEPDCQKNSMSATDETYPPNVIENETYTNSQTVESLIQLGLLSDVSCGVEDVNSAEVIIKQLLNVPTTRTPLIDRNLIITKIVKEVDDELCTVTKREPTLVTGRVAQFDETNDEWHFIYIPYMLRRLASKSNFDIDEEFDTLCGSPRKKIDKVRDDYLLHVHVVETRHSKTPTPTKTSISFLKRRLPKKNEAWACSACAKLFNTEKQLKIHQEVCFPNDMARCVDAEDEKPPLIIDTDKFSKQHVNKNNTVKGVKKNTCIYCNAKVKYSNYKRHLQSHFGPNCNTDTSGKVEESQDQGSKALYKCKMCSCSYIHASSLSKHIMTQHVKLRVMQQ